MQISSHLIQCGEQSGLLTFTVPRLWLCTFGLPARRCKVLINDGRTLVKGCLAQRVHAGLTARLAM